MTGESQSTTVDPLSSVLSYVTKYGLATVLCVVLVFYLIWTDRTVLTELQASARSMAQSQQQLVTLQTDLASALRLLSMQVSAQCGPAK